MTKQEIKVKAEAVARFLGYDTNSLSLKVINVLEMYCQGYSQALKDNGLPMPTETKDEDGI